MRRATMLAILLAMALGLPGCAGDSEMQSYLKAQLDALDKQKPLLFLEAQPGQTMELKGVKSLAVYAPQGSGGQIKPLESQWPSVWREALRVAGMVGGIYYGGQALSNLADAVGKNAGTHISGSFNTSGDHSPVGYSAGGGVNITTTSITTFTDNSGGGATP